MRDRKVGVWALMDYEIPSDEAMQGQRYTLDQAMQLGRVAKEIRVPVPERIRRRRSSRERVAESGLSARSPEKYAIFQLFLKLPLPRPPKIIASPSRMTATGTSGALVM